MSFRKNGAIKGFCLWSILILAIPAFLAGDSLTGMDSAKRLAGLGKVWGTVKFFHPVMACGIVDWDKALVESIPMVRAASTPEEYRAAIDHMLSFLKDPSTRAILPDTTAKEKPKTGVPSSSGAKAELSWPEQDIALLSARSHLMFSDPPKTEEFFKLAGEAAKAKTLIMDLRRTDGGSEDEAASYYMYNAVSSVLSFVLTGDLMLPSSRHIMYSGYPTQRGNSSGGYFSAFVYEGAEWLTGSPKRKKILPLIFLVNKECEIVMPLLSSLQIAGAATIIQEGASGEEGTPETIYTMDLPEGITIFMRTTESVNSDGTTGFSPNLSFPVQVQGQSDAALAAAVDIATGKKQAPRPQAQTLRPVPNFRPDDPYPDMAFPAAEYRLMALFRFWNIINNFFPYKHLLDRPWEETLDEFIPRMESAANAREYTLTVAEMVSRMTDSHGSVNSKDLREYFGVAYPPVEVKYVEGESVVTAIVSEFKDRVQGIQVGDVVTAVDGEDIGARRERIGRYISASTPQALSWRVHQNLLGGPKGSVIHLRIRNGSGKIEEKELTRNSDYVRSSRTTPVFGVLPDGFGYMDLARLTTQQVSEAFEAIKATPAVIFDMRGYPRGTAWSILPRLIEKKTAVAKFRRPEPHAVSLDWPSLVSFDQIIDPSPEWKYKGTVVVLINEEAISQAEHTCLFLEAGADARFVGSPTNGANGDVTAMALPGGIYVNFTGHDVRHADGRQLQRVGIQPHIAVKPTIAGIRAGKDEVLERAVAYLKNGK